MLLARVDEPVWGDARRTTLTDAFVQERIDIEQESPAEP
jgi:hypothetical protein